MATLIIPTPLRKFTANQSSFESKGGTVKDVVHELVSTHEGLKTHLLDDGGNLRSFIRIYVGDEDIQAPDQENTAVQPGATISIIPAIAGGSH